MTDNPTDSVVTDAMIEAGAKAIEACQYHGTSVEKQAVEAYRAMSQASPPPLSDEVKMLVRELRFFSSNALLELTPEQLEDWAGASRRAIAVLTACIHEGKPDA